MKKYVVGFALFTSGLSVGAFLRVKEPAAMAQVGDGAGNPVTPMSACGDVNGDGRLDISDGVYTLNFLFTGGRQPICRTGPLPATGQARCYNQTGATIRGCTGEVCPGQDAAYAKGCPAAGRFTDDGETVTDHCTGLMWQKEIADTNGDGKHDIRDVRPWCDALSYCENLSFAGHDDWRLPNFRELQSVLDYGRVAPAIDPLFREIIPLAYWTSTSYAADASLAWRVDLRDGGVTADDKAIIHNAVRAVRDAP